MRGDLTKQFSLRVDTLTRERLEELAVWGGRSAGATVRYLVHREYRRALESDKAGDVRREEAQGGQ